MTPASSDVPASSVTTGEPAEEPSVANGVAMDTTEAGEEEEEEDVGTSLVEPEEYRCETCNATFHSLTEFMDHRNFECITGG